MARHLSFFQQQLQREISGKHRGASPLWILLQPLLLLAVYSFVFTHIFQARVPANFDTSFVVYLALGYWPWSAFSECLLRNLSVINENAGLIKKVAIRRELLVLARTAAVFVLHIAGFIAVLIVLTAFGHQLSWLLFPIALVFILVLAILALGLSLLLSAVHVIVPAIANIVQPMVLLVFFSTPILWAPQMLPERFRSLIAWNPMAWWVTQFRALLLDGQLPAPMMAFIFCLGCVAVVWLGHQCFKRLAPHFEDYL